MNCSRCQAELDADDAFCRRCGQAAPGRDRQPPDRRAYLDPGPVPRTPPSLLMGDPMVLFWLLFGGIFAFVGTLLGLVFTVIGVLQGPPEFALVGPGVLLVFGGIGYGSLWHGIAKVRRLRALWRTGSLCDGELLEVARDRSIRVNRQSPLLVRYRYQYLGQSGEGRTHSWNESLRQLSPGARIAVLVDPADPTKSLAVLGDK